jgi:hypothetical protein
MSSDDRARAEARLEQKVRESGARDPRKFYEERLAELAERDPRAHKDALEYAERTLYPTVASGDADPVAAWTEFGRRLADAAASGKTVNVDGSGRSSPYSNPAPSDVLVLHLPQAGGRAMLVALPKELSEAQRATYDWLVSGKLKMRTAE